MFARRSLTLYALFAIVACGNSGAQAPTPSRGPQTVYISTTGSDRNSGTMSAPWQTLRYAVSQLQAGDTLYLRGGTYTGTDNTIDSQTGTVRSGASFSAAVTIAGQPGETVIIRPPANVSGIRLTTGAPAYVIFQDFIIDMENSTASGKEGGSDGVYLSSGAHHNRFLRLEVKNNSTNGFQFSDANGNSPFNEVINCLIHNNGGAAGENNGYGLYIETSDNLFAGNEVYENGGYGFHLYNNSGPLNVARNIVRDNEIHGNGTHGGVNYGVAVAWGDGNQVYGNRIRQNRGGILVYTNSTNSRVYNNTISGNEPLESILIQYATGTSVHDNIADSEIVDLGVGTQLSNNHTSRVR